MSDYETREVEFRPIELVSLHRLLNVMEVHFKQQEGTEVYARTAEMLDQRVTEQIFKEELLEDIDSEAEEYFAQMENESPPTTGIR